MSTYEDIRSILNRIDGLNVDEHEYQPFPEEDEFDINEDEDFEEEDQEEFDEDDEK